jgi:hypothetical protein
VKVAEEAVGASVEEIVLDDMAVVAKVGTVVVVVAASYLPTSSVA